MQKLAFLTCVVCSSSFSTANDEAPAGPYQHLPKALRGEHDKDVRLHRDDREPKKRKLMDMINKFRAEVCAKMKNEHGKDFDTYEACKEFMKEACNPGKDKKMDGDKSEVTSGEGFCEEYFHEQEAQKELKNMEDEEAQVTIAAPAPVMSSASAPKAAPAPAPAPLLATDVAAPAAVEAKHVPIPAPAPAPAGPAAPAAPLPDDEAWYFKDGGKSPGRMHMNEALKLPTQGYWGKLVEHEDMKTMSGDWGAEFGPIAAGNYAKICKDYPESAWCKRRLPHKRSWSCKPSMHLATLAMSILLWSFGAS